MLDALSLCSCTRLDAAVAAGRQTDMGDSSVELVVCFGEDRESAALGHGVSGVDGKVQEHLVHL